MSFDNWQRILQLLPWLTLSSALLPILGMAWRWGIYPTTRWAILLLPICAASLLIVLDEDYAYYILALDALAITVVALDLYWISGRSQIQVERVMQRAASIATPHPVMLHVDNRGTRALHLEIRDDAPEGIETIPAEQKVYLPAGKRIELSHSLRAVRRGAYQLRRVFFRFRSRLGLWVRLLDKPCHSTLHVYPDMKQLAEYAILARTNRLSLIGVRRTRRVGQDNNFERLRDYTQDDNFKHIDWRSTARRQKLTVKQFQSDQSQRVMFLLDCGRMMTNDYRNLSLVDYALNSILMLSYVALHQGDSVGLLSFSDTIHDFVPLRSGASQMNRLLHAGFDRFPKLVQSRFDQAFLHLSNHCRRRSMVVLITNVIDDVSANQITNYLSNLGGKHLPVLALLRDHRLFDFADNPDQDDFVLYRSAAAAQILSWRHEVLQRMQRQGILVIDAFPEQLTSPLVNQYLSAKASHLL